MDAIELALLKSHMRVDHDDDDDRIIALWDAAVEYLTGDAAGQSESPLFWLAAATLTLHWYDNPGFVGTDIGLPTGGRTVVTRVKLDQGSADYF